MKKSALKKPTIQFAEEMSESSHVSNLSASPDRTASFATKGVNETFAKSSPQLLTEKKGSTDNLSP
jgi:hypothetical protein